MDLEFILISAAFFFLGLFTGSFFNVLIYKVPRKLHIFRPYCMCFSCGQPMQRIASFPILAYISRKSKCCNCGKKVPIKSIILVLLTGLLYLLTYIIFGLSINTVTGLILTGILFVVSFIDWEFMIIPNIIVLPFTLVGLILSTLNIALGNSSKWWLPLAFCAGSFAFMLVIHLIYPKGMGMGDVKLALMLGAFLVKNVIAGLFLGFLIGSIAGIIFVLFKKKTLKAYIPFGPFISIGGLIAFFAGNYISGWFTGFF
jgi:leader peptidase (prepilin peptidase) / N-methyltransferase